MATTAPTPRGDAPLAKQGAGSIALDYRRARSTARSKELVHGTVPIPKWMDGDGSTTSLLKTAGIAVAVFLVVLSVGQLTGVDWLTGLAPVIGGIAFYVLLLGPFVRWLWVPLFQGGSFNVSTFTGVSKVVQFFYGFVPVSIVGTIVVVMIGFLESVIEGVTDLSILGTFGIMYVLAIAAGLAFPSIAGMLDGKRLPMKVRAEDTSATDLIFNEPGPLGIWLGESTGTLSAQGHTMGAAPKSQIMLKDRDLFKNILFVGDIGSAKTSAGIVPMTLQLMDTGAAFVFIDGKGEAAEPIARAGERIGRKVQRIGVNGLGFNLLAGLTPKQATKLVLDALHLSGQRGSESAFWVGSVTSLAENALAILSVDSETYNMDALYRFVYRESYRTERLSAANERLAELQARVDAGDRTADVPKRALRIACDYFADVFEQMNEKTRNDVNATFGTVLQKFQDPELVDAFCSSTQEQARLADLEDGTIFVLDLPLAKFDLAAQFILLFIKEAVFRLVKGRYDLAQDDPARTRPVGIICDEYQKIVSATDGDSLDVMRSLNGFVIAGTQSINAMYKAIGDEASTKALLANFVQKITFGTSDPDTIEYISSIIGEADVYRETTGISHTRSVGGGEGTIHSTIAAFAFGQQSTSQSVSATLQRLKVVTAQTFRQLVQTERTAQALALLKINDVAYDDVVVMPKIYFGDL